MEKRHGLLHKRNPVHKLRKVMSRRGSSSSAHQLAADEDEAAAIITPPKAANPDEAASFPTPHSGMASCLEGSEGPTPVPRSDLVTPKPSGQKDLALTETDGGSTVGHSTPEGAEASLEGSPARAEGRRGTSASASASPASPSSPALSVASSASSPGSRALTMSALQRLERARCAPPPDHVLGPRAAGPHET